MRRLGGLVAACTALSCLGDTTGPQLRRGRLAVVPSFSAASAALVDFDRVRITLERPDAGARALDTIVAIPPGVDSVDLVLTVPLTAATEELLLYLRLVNVAGDTVFRNDPYPQRVVVTAAGTAAPVLTSLDYVGVGSNAVAVAITTPDGLIFFGQVLSLNAVALGPGGQPIGGTPIAWRSLDPNRASVPDRAVGQVLGGTQRGPARIVAGLLTGPEDTMVVTAQPQPAALAVYSGDGQTAAVGTPLAQSLRVRVSGSDGLGVQVPVAFRALAPGASVSATLDTSDAAGLAEVRATLGPGVGPQAFEASVAGLSPVLFTAQAVPDSAVPTAVVFAGDSTDGTVSSSGVFRVNPDGSGRFRLNDRGSRGDVHPRWSPDRQRVAFAFNALGRNELFVTAATGGEIATLVTDTGAFRARWNREGMHLAFECGPGSGSLDDVCVIPDIAGPISTLQRKGDGNGRFVVTDFHPARLDGPGSFVWDPADSKRLIVVRDSLTTALLVASRLWTVQFDGTLPMALSPEVMDLGKGPLRIEGPLDVTPDGLTIVFSAVDPGGNGALFLIGRDGSGLRQLTPGLALDSRPVFSPDGRQVLFIRDVGCSLDYWRVDVATGLEQRVSDERLCDITPTIPGHDWSPDGKDIVLVGTDGVGNFLILSLPAATTAATYTQNRRLIGRGVDAGGFVTDIQPSWRP